MVKLPFRPAPFFANKNAAFWNLQFAGWGGVFALRAVSAVANEQPWDLLLVVLVQVITGFAISLILSVVYRHLMQRNALVTWGLTAVTLALAVALYAAIDAWLQGIYFSATRETTFAQRIVGLAFLDGTLLGAWSALYYATNFFLTVEEQADRLERLEAQATSAQLAMLRYQLNPHFLFNTLNAISSSVLTGKPEAAEATLTRLCAFLRATLAASNSGMVAVEDELQTIADYLAIEKARLGDRLRLEFECPPSLRDAAVPSFLLQPLVENAITHGSVRQAGSLPIRIHGRRSGDRLLISVTNEGTAIGLEAVDETIHESVDTARFGLRYVRERLKQFYGDDARFTLDSAGNETVALIDVPFLPPQVAEA